MNKFYLTLVAGAILAAAQSCSEDGYDSIVETKFNGCFTYVADESGDYFTSNVEYTLKLNYSRGIADLAINNFKTPSGVSYPKITLEDMPWKISTDGWITISTDKIKPKQGAPIFDKLYLRIFGRGDSLHPGLAINYTIDGNIDALASFGQQMVFGKTVSSGGNLHYETNSTYYVIAFDTTNKTADITMFGARFIEQMPAMDITLPGVPFEINGTTAKWNVENLTPTSGTDNVPQEGFPITNLKGEFDFAGNYKMEFDCTPRTMGGLSFHVTTDCSFSSMPSNNDK